jgi:two-component system sensor histidine kinase KdpD
MADCGVRRATRSAESHKEFVKTHIRADAARYDQSVAERSRPTGEQMLAKPQADQRARLRIYIGAAPGVGKTYSMIEDAHTFHRDGIDVVIGFVETHGRAETEARLGDLEIIPRRRIEYRGVILEEMDSDAILTRKPQLCVVDELAHTNAAGRRHEKRIRTCWTSSTPASAS